MPRRRKVLLLLQPVINRLEVRTPDPVHFLSILQHDKGGHGSDVELLSHTPHFIHIDLEESHILVLFAELADLGSNGLAGAAPGRVEVDENGAGGYEGFEDHLAVDASRCQYTGALKHQWITLILSIPRLSTYLSMLDTFP